MPRAFAAITFTESVKKAQSRYHSREENLGFEKSDESRHELTERESAFIESRDSFYQATVSENGWPYVQHRGGPKGFLKVLDQNTLGFGDFSGNAQYLSVGNLQANDRISIILMDYSERRRLKIWGRVRIVHELDHQELIDQVEMPSYRARIERAFIIAVEAWDWNCPQHITPRFSDTEIEDMLLPLQEELATLKAHSKQAAVLKEIGDGPLPLVVSGIRQLTPVIREIELRHPEGLELPSVSPGAHLAVPVMLKNGNAAIRHYSISSNPHRRDIYKIAILLTDAADPYSEGGSAYAYQAFHLGLILHCGEPKNNFSLIDTLAPAVFIAGGIGITAIKPMVQSLMASGRQFQLHYAAASAIGMAYREHLKHTLKNKFLSYFSDENQRMNLMNILSASRGETHFYVCGPQRLIDESRRIAQQIGISPERIIFERFSPIRHSADQAFEVILKRSSKTIQVAAGQSIKAAATAAGVKLLSECGIGHCGTCAVKILDGIADHRDTVLLENEKGPGGKICICVSRSKTARLYLDC